MKNKSRLQEIIENNAIYQQLDAANDKPGRLGRVKVRESYNPEPTKRPLAWTDALLSYGFGLIGMSILGGILAAAFNYRILFGLQQSGFEPLPTGLVITLLYPLILVVFGFIAWVSRSWTFLIYPFAMLAITGLFADNSFIHWLAGWLPFADISDNGRPVFSLYASIAVFVMVMLIYGIEKPVRHLSLAHGPKRLHVGLLVSVIVVVAVTSVVGEPLRLSQARSRQAVHLPNMSDVSAFNPTEDGYRLAYRQPDAVLQQNYDILKITPVQDWWHRDIHDVCGASTALGENMPVYEYSYRASGGQLYAAAASNNTEYICAVIGYQRYDIEREVTSWRYATYGTPSVITSLVTAKSFVLYCDDDQVLPTVTRAQRQAAQDGCTPSQAADYARSIRQPGIVAKDKKI